MTAIFNYKTSSVAGTKGNVQTPASGKANTAPAATSTGSPTDTYLDQLEKLGNQKMGKTPPPTGSEGDPVAELLNTLDQASQQGASTFAKISAESVLGKFPDSPEDILEKYQSIVSILEKKINDITTALSNGGGTTQQVAAAQKLKSDLEGLLAYYKLQATKVDAYATQKIEKWNVELEKFKATGGLSDPRDFDKDGDGWIGRPEAKGSYRIGIRTFDKKSVDPVAKEMVAKNKSLKLQSEFKKDEKQYWAINPETNKRVQFDPITGKVLGDQAAAPNYVADLGNGFGNSDGTVKSNAKGEMELQVDKLSAKNFAEAGLELHTPEYIWVEVDADGDPITDDSGQMKPSPFEIKGGGLVQKTPSLDGNTQYKQVYVKEMRVSTDSADGTAGGDIVVQLRGGDDNTKIMSMRITGAGDVKKASDVALAITSGTGDNHRETPIILDAGGYQSTSKQGMSEATFKEIFKDASGDEPNMKNPQIQDTFSHFKAGSKHEISSLRNRGISFKTAGHIIGTDDHDLFVQEEPPAYVGPMNADGQPNGAYASVIEGGNGNNILLGKKGSVFANGMTLVSKNSDAQDMISIGINAYREEKTGFGNLHTAKGKESNKLYIHVKAENSQVAVQSAPDVVDTKKIEGQNDPLAFQAGDDYYDVSADTIAITAIDGANPNQPFDPDLQAQPGGRIPLKGNKVSAATNDFTVASKAFSEHIKGIETSIKKKATDNSDFDWKVEGAKIDWMQGKYYKSDKNMLETFFADFKASKVKELDPFKQLSEGMDEAAGEPSAGGDE